MVFTATDPLIDGDGFIACVTRNAESPDHDPDVWACIRFGFLTEPDFKGKSLEEIAELLEPGLARQEALRMSASGKTVRELHAAYDAHLTACDACQAYRTRTTVLPFVPPNRTREAIERDIAGIQT